MKAVIHTTEKSILIDDDLSVIGSFNMDMRSAYLDTELMLVIRSKEINKQLEEGMMEYERVSRQVLEDGTYRDPYHVEPIELTKKRQRKIFLVQHLLDGQGICFNKEEGKRVSNIDCRR